MIRLIYIIIFEEYLLFLSYEINTYMTRIIIKNVLQNIVNNSRYYILNNT